MSVGSEARTVAEAVEDLVAPVAHALGVTLVDLEVRRAGRRALVRVFIDKPQGVGIQDCQRLSEEIGDLIDVSELIPESYDLEVSSPGLDRELRRDRELDWARGKRVRVWTREALEGRRELAGELGQVDAGVLELVEADGVRPIPRTLITKVRLDEERPRPLGSGSRR